MYIFTVDLSLSPLISHTDLYNVLHVAHYITVCVRKVITFYVDVITFYDDYCILWCIMYYVPTKFCFLCDFLTSRENLIQFERKPLVLKEEVIKANTLVR